MATATMLEVAMSVPAAERAVTPAAAARVEARGLVVRYGARVAVDGVDLALAPGEVFALLGRNGSGKSSLARALLGIQPRDGGSVRVLGRDPARERASLMSEVGYVPEEPQARPFV